MDERERHAKGMEIRRQVLGDAHVEGARAATTELTADFQDLITRYAWGEIWARPGLPRRTRSLVTIAMLVALNRPEELRLHLRAAAACGVTRDELRELLLHAAVYCGVPAAHAAFHLAEAELPPALRQAQGERDRQPPPTPGQAQGERGDPENPMDDGGRT